MKFKCPICGNEEVIEDKNQKFQNFKNKIQKFQNKKGDII